MASDRKALTDALVMTGMPACDPNENGATVAQVATPVFMRALNATMLRRNAVQRSVDAAERAGGVRRTCEATTGPERAISSSCERRC